jgi:hypothetical protein
VPPGFKASATGVVERLGPVHNRAILLLRMEVFHDNDEDLSVVVTLLGFLVQLSAGQQVAPKPSGGHVRTYYVAADEVEWDYAPHGIDHMTGKPFEGFAMVHTERGPHRIGTKYLKACYREYTGGTFQKLKERKPEENYLGIVGPVLHAEVGDTIKVLFSPPRKQHPVRFSLL